MKNFKEMKTLQINNKHCQECNVVMLPTKDDSARIIKSEDRDYLVFVDKWSGKHIANHLYILSNDEIKEGDWFFNGEHILQCSAVTDIIIDTEGQWSTIGDCKKIIATTDKSLRIHKSEILGKINGHTLGKVKSLLLSQISQSFIEYFISEYNKGNVISKVLVEVEEGLNKPLHEALKSSEPLCFKRIKLNQSNEIYILTEQKQVFSREEVVELLLALSSFKGDQEDYEEVNEWIQENLK
jgi:hypothetical protein